MPIYQIGSHSPDISPDAFVAPQASIIGKVVLKARSSVWFGAVIRGDNELITSAKKAMCRRERYCTRIRACR